MRVSRDSEGVGRTTGATIRHRASPRRGEKVSETIARQIVRDIVLSGLQPGTVLQPEVDMVERYGIGRASLREALRILEVQGLISLKPGPGGGPVVSAVHSADFGRMATLYFQMAGATFRELCEARLVIEPLMARLAASGSDTDDHEALRRTVEDELEVDISQDDPYLQATWDFHGTVSGMSGNRILDLFGRALKEVFTERINVGIFDQEDRQGIIETHTTISRAILKGHPQAAERLMREHMADIFVEVARKYPGLLDEVVEWH